MIHCDCGSGTFYGSDQAAYMILHRAMREIQAEVIGRG